MKSAIIVGATSGIGRYLAIELSKRGYTLGLTGRRMELLESLRDELQGGSVVVQMDVTKFDEAREKLRELIGEMENFELIVLNAGILSTRKGPDWELEKQLIDTNVTGFCALLETAWKYFEGEGKPGHIVGISSVAAMMPNGGDSAYSASKAFISNYMAGLQVKASKRKLPILVTDVKPGFVETPMTSQNKEMFWVSTPEKAAKQIADGIQRKKYHIYITRRWRLIGWLSKILPNAFFRAFGR